MLIKNIGVVLSVLLVGVFWFFMFKRFFNALKARKKALKELEKPVKPVPLTSQKATVIAKRTEIKYGTGVRLPSHTLKYFVTFSVNGTANELEVSKDLFETVTENTTATLVTSDGFFYSFE